MNGELLGRLDQKEMWGREESLDSREPMEFLDTQDKAGPEEDLAMMVAMEPKETQGHKGPLDLGASLASLGPKDPRGRKVNLTHCLIKTATNTGVTLESLECPAIRGLLAARGQ